VKSLVLQAAHCARPFSRSLAVRYATPTMMISGVGSPGVSNMSDTVAYKGNERFPSRAKSTG